MADDVAALADEIEARLAALPELSTAPVRAVRREYSRRLQAAPAETVLALAYALLDRAGPANRFVAYELVHHHRAALRRLARPELERLGRGLDDWAAVDTFACYLSGPAWREGQVPEAVIEAWARSPDRWWRRAALVSTVPLNTAARGGRGDPSRTFRICRLLVADRDDMVVKALSWALRELIRYDPEGVQAFLNEHSAVLAPRVRREVTHKLTTGLKNPRRTAGG